MTNYANYTLTLIGGPANLTQIVLSEYPANNTYRVPLAPSVLWDLLPGDETVLHKTALYYVARLPNLGPGRHLAGIYKGEE